MIPRIISSEDLDLLTQEQVCAILKLTLSGLRRRIYLGQAPRPRHRRSRTLRAMRSGLKGLAAAGLLLYGA